jgi:hypothetical protein
MRIVNTVALLLSALIIVVILLSGCTKPEATQAPTREGAIPLDALKSTPETDANPPEVHSNEFTDPVPLPYTINTAGAEDSPFILPSGDTLYFFFTPDVRVPPEKQLLDGVTGIYISTKRNGLWSKPERIILQDPGRLSLDGCEFVRGNVMWFCSAREGYTGVNLFTATFEDGKWGDWHYAGDTLNKEYQVGEMHITRDGSKLYFHSLRAGGKGQLDIWVSEKIDGEWQTPQNVESVNSPENEGWPFITDDSRELWFTRTYMGMPSVFRSRRVGNEWSVPELILSSFAGEPTLDGEGNLYFAHHFFKDGTMIEADIYVAYHVSRKTTLFYTSHIFIPMQI